MNDGPRDIKSYTPEELAVFMEEIGQPSYRGKQVFQWLHRGVSSFDEMTDLPKPLREQLARYAKLTAPVTLARRQSAADGTVKVLRSFDGAAVESVLMAYKHGNTLCLSTQAGCRMGCVFCASTVKGLDRNLAPSEMLDQVLCMAKEEGRKIKNIVLMGTGEPLDNFDNVLKFLAVINHPDGLNISHRHISLSTCGLADKIVKLSEKRLQITLSVSLHAPFDDLRDSLMPVNRAFPLKVLMAACRRYFEATRRRISFEYAMIDGMNDTERCAVALVRLLSGLAAHVNLIPLSRVRESGLSGSPPIKVQAFYKKLTEQGVKTTVRRSLGADIDASCGQLRNNILGERER